MSFISLTHLPPEATLSIVDYLSPSTERTTFYDTRERRQKECELYHLNLSLIKSFELFQTFCHLTLSTIALNLTSLTLGDLYRFDQLSYLITNNPNLLSSFVNLSSMTIKNCLGKKSIISRLLNELKYLRKLIKLSIVFDEIQHNVLEWIHRILIRDDAIKLDQCLIKCEKVYMTVKNNEEISCCCITKITECNSIRILDLDIFKIDDCYTLTKNLPFIEQLIIHVLTPYISYTTKNKHDLSSKKWEDDDSNNKYDINNDEINYESERVIPKYLIHFSLFADDVPISYKEIELFIQTLVNLKYLSLYATQLETDEPIDGSSLEQDLLVYLPQIEQFKFDLRYKFDYYSLNIQKIQSTFKINVLCFIINNINNDYNYCLCSLPYSFQNFQMNTTDNQFDLIKWDTVEFLTIDASSVVVNQDIEKIFPNVKKLMLNGNIKKFPVEMTPLANIDKIVFKSGTTIADHISIEFPSNLTTLTIDFNLLLKMTNNFSNDNLQFVRHLTVNDYYVEENSDKLLKYFSTIETLIIQCEHDVSIKYCCRFVTTAILKLKMLFSLKMKFMILNNEQNENIKAYIIKYLEKYKFKNIYYLHCDENFIKYWI